MMRMMRVSQGCRGFSAKSGLVGRESLVQRTLCLNSAVQQAQLMDTSFCDHACFQNGMRNRPLVLLA
jgi:hypothetical protein